MSGKVFKNREPLETGIESGIEWEIYLHDSTGAINGYARIPEGHAWRTLDDWQWGCSSGVEVHGGITFGITNEGWIGFDTSHAGDYWKGGLMSRYHIGEIHTYWNQELVVLETKKLARQIANAPAKSDPIESFRAKLLERVEENCRKRLHSRMTSAAYTFEGKQIPNTHRIELCQSCSEVLQLIKEVEA